MIDRLDFFFFVPALLLSTLKPLFLPSLSVSLSLFILAVPIRECLGKHSCMSSPFPTAILNGTFFFRSVKAINNWKRSAIKQILLLLLTGVAAVQDYGCGSSAGLWVYQQVTGSIPGRGCIDFYCANGAEGVLLSKGVVGNGQSIGSTVSDAIICS